MVESIIANSGEGMACQKVYGTIETGESFKVGGRGG